MIVVFITFFFVIWGNKRLTDFHREGQALLDNDMFGSMDDGGGAFQWANQFSAVAPRLHTPLWSVTATALYRAVKHISHMVYK